MTKSLLYTWNTIPNLYGSDHFPAIIEAINKHNIDKTPKWNFKQANWTRFSHETRITRTVQDFPTIELAYQHLVNTILTAAKNSIPLKSLKPSRPPVPWWNKECNIQKKILRSVFKRRFWYHEISFMNILHIVCQINVT